MIPDLLSAHGSKRRLLIGLAVIAALFVAQGLVSTLVTYASETQARQLSENSIASIEQIARVARDVDQQRILIDDHVFQKDELKMTAVERRLVDVETDLRQAKTAYASLLDLPNEEATWKRAQGLLDRLEQELGGVLELSRKNYDSEAASRMTGAVTDYDDLNRQLVALIEINRTGAADALARATTLQQRAEVLRWSIRIAAVIAMVFIGWLGVRRIAAYENEIAEYARELEERNQDLDAFAGRVAHDLKNALGPIMMSSTILRRSAGLSSAVLEISNRIDRASRRATNIIEALLAFSKASRGAEPNESAALRPVVMDVHEELAPLAAQLEVSMEVADVPDLSVRCDRGLLHIVLANLCGNAVKFLEARPERRVRLSAYAEDASCRIEVQDTGPGIPKEALARIFEPFFRVQGTRAPGTGIGLATVRRILDSRGGRIAVESSEGRGSRFTIWIPLARSSSN